MKQKRKVFSTIVLAVIMLLAAATTAFAAGTGTITVENATNGKVYEAYKILDASYDENSDAVAYTVSKSSPWYNVVKNSGLFDLVEVPAEADVFNVVPKSTTTDAQITALFTGQFEWNDTDSVVECKVTGAAPENTATADADGTLEIGDLPYGYYVLTSNLGATVTIDTTHPNAVVIDKNEGPDWDNEPGGDEGNPNPGKVIVEGSAKKQLSSSNYGDTVDFDIAINATNFAGSDQVTYYYISDILGDGFDFDPANDDIEVTVTDKNGTYDITDACIFTTDGKQSFQVAIPWCDYVLDTDGTIKSFTEKYDTKAQIHVTYSAKINEDGTDVVIGEMGNVNTANFTYLTEKPGDEPKPQPDPDDPFDPENPDEGNPGDPYKPGNKAETRTYVFALAIQKLNEDGEPLEGAVFTVEDSEGNLIAAPESATGVYQYDTTATNTEFVTGADGYMILKGVKEGTYTITEVKAPKGYNLLTASKEYVIEAPEKDSNNWPNYIESVITTVYYDADGNVIDTEDPNGTKVEYKAPDDLPVEGIGIVNNSGKELPATGGIGTTIFYVIGGILFVSAFVLLIARKKMSSEA